MANLEKIVEELSSLTVLEAAELAKLLEEKWGVSAAAAVAALHHLLSAEAVLTGTELLNWVAARCNTPVTVKPEDSCFTQSPVTGSAYETAVTCHESAMSAGSCPAR